MTTIIKMPIEKTEPPEPPGPPGPVDDLDRWVSVAFMCIGLAGLADDDHGLRTLLLHSLLTAKFSDVPDAPPSPDEILRELRDPSPRRAVLAAALARWAVKKLLKALTANDEERRRSAQAADTLFAELSRD